MVIFQRDGFQCVSMSPPHARAVGFGRRATGGFSRRSTLMLSWVIADGVLAFRLIKSLDILYGIDTEFSA